MGSHTGAQTWAMGSSAQVVAAQVVAAILGRTASILWYGSKRVSRVQCCRCGPFRCIRKYLEDHFVAVNTYLNHQGTCLDEGFYTQLTNPDGSVLPARFTAGWGTGSSVSPYTV